MAILVSAATGNLTAAATWKVVDTGTFTTLRATQEFSTNAVAVGTTSSPNFTVAANITVDAVLLKHFSTNASDNETITVSIFNVTAGTTVASVTRGPGSFPILTNTPNWFQFEFSGGFALTTATNYQIRITGVGSNNHVTLYRKSATVGDWTFGLRTTTTAAPANGDLLLICGKYAAAGGLTSYTVTNNNTNAALLLGNGVAGTSGIEVSYGSKLVNEATASTNYSLRVSGDYLFNGGSTFECGTVAAPFPQSSTATFEVFQPAAARFSLISRSTANAVSYFTCYENQTGKRLHARGLTAAIPAAATSCSVLTGTNWKSGDEIVVGTTARDYTQVEYRTMSANETTGTVSVSAAFTHAHDQWHDFAYNTGSGPQNEVSVLVANLTKNIVWKGTSTTLRAGNFDTGNTAQIKLSGVLFQNWGRIGVIQQYTTDLNGSDVWGTAFIQDVVIKDHSGGIQTVTYNPVSLELYKYTSARPLAASSPALVINSITQSLINGSFTFYFNDILSYGGTGTVDGRVRFYPRLTSANIWDAYSGGGVYGNIYINGLFNAGNTNYFALDWDGGQLPSEGGSGWLVDLWATVAGCSMSQAVAIANATPSNYLRGIACIRNSTGIYYDTDWWDHFYVISQENTSHLLNLNNPGSPYAVNLLDVKLGISTGNPTTNVIFTYNSSNFSVNTVDFYGGTSTTIQSANFLRYTQAGAALYGTPKITLNLDYWSSPLMTGTVDQYSANWNYFITNNGRITITSIANSSALSFGPVTYIKNGYLYSDNFYYLNSPSTAMVAGTYGNITSPSKFVAVPPNKKLRASVWVYTTVSSGTATTTLQGFGGASVSTNTTGAWTKLVGTTTVALSSAARYELTVTSTGTGLQTWISDWNVELI